MLLGMPTRAKKMEKIERRLDKLRKLIKNYNLSELLLIVIIVICYENTSVKFCLYAF